MNMRAAPWLSEIAFLALAWFSLLLLGTGMFCFEDQFFTMSFDNRTARAPDCFLVHMNAEFNPKTWLVLNLTVALALTATAQATAIGFFRKRRSSKMVAICGSLSAAVYFAEIAATSEDFRSLAAVGCVAFGALASLAHFFLKGGAVEP